MSASSHFWKGIGLQLRCPSGHSGRLIGRLMALVNRQPNKLAVDALSVTPTDTILELGFGPGLGVKAVSALAPHGLVLGIDQSPDMLALASRNNRRAIAEGRIQLGLGQFAKLPFPSESVDKILAVNVIYFFSRTAAEIREAKRVLRPGGVMAIYATERSTMSRWKFAAEDTHSLFDEDELRALIMRGGFLAEDVAIHRLALPFGVKGLLALLTTPTRCFSSPFHLKSPIGDR
jgi:SAM-dependent methyltransferase